MTHLAKRSRKVWAGLNLGLFLAIASSAGAEVIIDSEPRQPRILEAYPAQIGQQISRYEREVSKTGFDVAGAPRYLVVPVHRRWRPGQTITVAFKGGSPELYALIEQAAQAWTKPGAANLTLRFRDASGGFVTWSTSNRTYSGMIRISFDDKGYWSMVGTNSVDANLTGGGANEASMNLEGFDSRLPFDWEAIVKHEFGHALGFEHEHQSPAGGCDFRFEDDSDYVRTLNSEGYPTLDAAGRRPGLYTILGGPRNYWPRPKVDFNLRTITTSSAYLTGDFDRTSIMKYFFDESMFASGSQSACYTQTENLDLSPQDIVGAHRAYPDDPALMAQVISQQMEVLRALQARPGFLSGNIRESATNRIEATGL